MALAREGVKVAIADINKEALGETAKKIADVGGKSLSLLWDLGDLSRIDESISSIEAEFESVDILVNNTGGPPQLPLPVRTLKSGSSISTLWLYR